ncbi:hypothetical protein DDT56_23280 [Brenneria corticis]|uniref:Uncharacterized protein n=2 Tax=Brenneria corticis TaxID=2173106 RepID=A0A2U1TJZ1_9GAMM|nr:hypothetical protein DDT56_23280 [Brenneria sp. CFCC 11842]
MGVYDNDKDFLIADRNLSRRYTINYKGSEHAWNSAWIRGVDYTFAAKNNNNITTRYLIKSNNKKNVDGKNIRQIYSDGTMVVEWVECSNGDVFLERENSTITLEKNGAVFGCKRKIVSSKLQSINVEEKLSGAVFISEYYETSKFLLPSAQIGLCFKFIVTKNKGISIICYGGDAFRMGKSEISSSNLGDSVNLICVNEGVWDCEFWGQWE